MAIADNKHFDPNDTRLDPDAAEFKQHYLQKLKKSTLLKNISDTAKFIAGPLFSIAAGAIITGLTGGAAAAGATATAAAATPIGMVLMAAAAATLVVAIATDYASSRIFQGGGVDSMEENARATAAQMIKQLKANHLCLTPEYEGNCRADGKQWQHVVTQNSQQPGLAQA